MQVESDFILSLADASAELAQVGGKGASLARLAAVGLPVPPGFHVTTAAYRRFVAENALQPRILAALQAVRLDQPDTLESASTHIRHLFAQAAIPPAITSEIRTAYLALANSKSGASGESIQNPKPVVNE